MQGRWSDLQRRTLRSNSILKIPDVRYVGRFPKRSIILTYRYLMQMFFKRCKYCRRQKHHRFCCSDKFFKEVFTAGGVFSNAFHSAIKIYRHRNALSSLSLLLFHILICILGHICSVPKFPTLS